MVIKSKYLFLIVCFMQVIVSRAYAQEKQDSGYCDQYYFLKSLLPKYDSLGQLASSVNIPARIDLSEGMKDPVIVMVRKRLKEENYFFSENFKPDSFDCSLKQALLAYQENNGCELSGRIDLPTVSAMNIPYKKRAEQIQLNMERWKSIPANYTQRCILVNVAGFSLQLIDKGTEVMRMKIIVGRLYRKTPVIFSQLSQIVFNPEWSVPKNILVKDIVPEIKKDPLYLSKHHMRPYRFESDGSRLEVEGAQVDWHEANSEMFPFVLVQEPGPWNALGLVKFLFPNSYHVYMHDTPSKELFRSKEPAYSSGCIRLSKAMELAEYLLAEDGTGWTKEKLEQIHEGGEANYTLVLRQALPVYINYFTVWVEKDGFLQFRRDLYDKDQSELPQD